MNVFILQGRIQDFRLGGGGGDLKKLRRAEGGPKNVGVFRVRNHNFMPKNHIFSNFRGGGGGVHRVCPPPPPVLCIDSMIKSFKNDNWQAMCLLFHYIFPFFSCWKGVYMYINFYSKIQRKITLFFPNQKFSLRTIIKLISSLCK